MAFVDVARGLEEKLADWWLRHDLFDPCGVFTNPAIFVESYAIRAGVQHVRMMEGRGISGKKSGGALRGGVPEVAGGLAEDALVRREVKTDDGCERAVAGAVAFCERVVNHQGVQGPPAALMMGYGLKVRDGVVEHACVADQASIAAAVLETAALLPGHERAGVWVGAIERWADWVLGNFARPNGAIGVGIFCHKWNPIEEFWCATSLASGVFFQLAGMKRGEKYGRAGMLSLEWMARFDFEKSEIPAFADCGPEVILYSLEGLAAGMKYLVETKGVEAARQHAAAGKIREMVSWLVENQMENGRWPEPRDRGYRDYSVGIPWLLLEVEGLIGPEEKWRGCAERMLGALATVEGERYYGMYVRPFTMGLAWMSAGSGAGIRGVD